MVLPSNQEGGKIPLFCSASSTLLTKDRNVFVARMLSTSGRMESLLRKWLYGYSYMLRTRLGANRAEAAFIPGIPAKHKGTSASFSREMGRFGVTASF